MPLSEQLEVLFPSFSVLLPLFLQGGSLVSKLFQLVEVWEKRVWRGCKKLSRFSHVIKKQAVFGTPGK